VKTQSYANQCEKAGLSLRQAYAAALKWQSLFLRPDGEFSWFFKRMRLAYRRGSFLFVHAGIDDRTAKLINRRRVKQLNQQFLEHVAEMSAGALHESGADLALAASGIAGPGYWSRPRILWAG
jgi:hypothetical protein